jgi:ornithine decarboxylase
MRVKPLDYYNENEWSLFKNEADRHETPFLVVNLDIIKRNYEELVNFYPYSKIYYAVKANPANEVIELLRDLGSCFDIASIYELDKVLALGVNPDRISYGNTVKKARDIKYFYENGVRLFVSDSEADIRNLAAMAPGARVYLRITVEGSNTADWPLSRKFGCHPDMAIDLLSLAKKLGLNPCGISFHVGSQQRDVGAWDSAIAMAKYIFDYMSNEGIKLELINLGGGLPANYISKTNPPDIYAREITRYLQEDFGDDMPEIIMEPGRSLVGDSGILVSEVVLVSRKSRVGVDRWVFLDTGKFNGLIETWDESIKYPIYCEKNDYACDEGILAGPTCDSQDIMYYDYRYKVPVNLSAGDRVYWFTAGAYTASYCAVEFNGFPPLKTYFVGGK